MAQPRIADELCGGVADRVYWHYFDPDVTMRSYAALQIPDCSATMIGPNLLLTAGHCNQTATTVRFRVYTNIDGDCNGTDPGAQMTEQFDCDYLLHTWPDTDMTLYYVHPNAGVNPGDKYGYVDFDIIVDQYGVFDYGASHAKVTLDKPQYSVWWNPVNDIGGDHMLYSEGEVILIDIVGHWSNPMVPDPNYPQFRCYNSRCASGPDSGQCCCGDSPCAGGADCVRRPDIPVAAETSVWGHGGASGSAQLSTDTHRILLAPLTFAPPTGGSSRKGLPIADYLQHGWVDPNLADPNFCSDCPECPSTFDQINQPFLLAMGLNPALFFGAVDQNVDGIFDVQHDLEVLLGEGQRDWYWLGFESVRRNALWTRNGGGAVGIDTADPVVGMAEFDTLGIPSDFMPMLSHGQLNLAGGRFYNITFILAITDAAHSQPIRVSLEGDGDSNFEDFDAPGSFQTCVTRLWAPMNPVLRFYAKGNTRAYITAVSVVPDPIPLTDFDMHDKRYMWVNRNIPPGGRGLVWPNGNTSSVEVDWAGVVLRDPNRPLDDDWSLGNNDLVIDGGYEYRISFEHHVSDRVPLSAGSQGVMRVVGDSGPIAGSIVTFTPGSAWSEATSDWFSVPGDHNDLQFGVFALDAGATGGYLVDDILIERRQPATIYVDWRNEGFENGAAAYPFDTVWEGVLSVEPGGTVVIADGAYPEDLTIDKALVLTAAGGVVTIGG